MQINHEHKETSQTFKVFQIHFEPKIETDHF